MSAVEDYYEGTETAAASENITRLSTDCVGSEKEEHFLFGGQTILQGGMIR